jgi:formylglycine-generating enzyme required for sulfatase activity
MLRLTSLTALTVLTTLTALIPGAAAPVPPREKMPRESFTETVVIHPDPDTEKRVTFYMVFVPGGEFTMGDQADAPPHKVRVGNFWMGRCEVTWDEFDLFRADETYLRADDHKAAKLGPDAITRPTCPFVDETYGHEREGHPAICMTHHAAMTYCHWLRAKTKKSYRLPTEAEWEYAARGGKGDSPYWFGADGAELHEYAWFKENSPDPDHPKGTTHKVGTKKPNPFGLYDMYGNVAEWTLDQYDEKAYEKRLKNPLSIRPVTVPTEKKWSHVVRGGSWADRAERCRSSTRRVSDKSWQKWDPNEPQSIWWLTKMDVIGFRVLLVEDEQPELIGLTPKVVKTASN